MPPVDRDLAGVGRRLGARYLSRGIRNILAPVDYTRIREIPLLVALSGVLAKRTQRLRILDAGSPQILSMYLASASPSWEIVYINRFEPELDRLEEQRRVLGLRNVTAASCDLTDRSTVQKLGRFDYVFSCSVFEHIHPEADGDSLASANLRSVMAAGATCTISVPFSTSPFNEYRVADVYGNRGSDAEKVFFQRFYDERTLRSRIIEPTGFSVIAQSYLGERFYFPGNIHRRLGPALVTGRVKPLLLGPTVGVLSRVFMEEASDWRQLGKPYIAVVAMRTESQGNA